MKLELPLRIDLTVAKSQFSTSPNSWGDKLNSQIQKQCMNMECPYDFADRDGGGERKTLEGLEREKEGNGMRERER